MLETDSSTIHRASPLCLDLTFPSGATQEEEEEEKTENRKLKGFWELFLSCLPADGVFACTHQTLGEADTKTNTYSTHRCIDTQTEDILPGSVGLSRCLHLQTWNGGVVIQRHHLRAFMASHTVTYSVGRNYKSAYILTISPSGEQRFSSLILSFVLRRFEMVTESEHLR